MEGCRLKSKWDLNEHYLDELSTEEQFYFLGFFFADVYNNLRYGKSKPSKGTLTINLEKSDEKILYRFRELFSSNADLLYLKAATIYNKWTQKEYLCKEAVRLNLNSVYLCNRMAQLGAPPGKTYSLKYPQYIPDDMQRHFLRGYFDGDGSITSHPNASHPICNVVGARSFLTGMAAVIEENLGFYPHLARIKKNVDERITSFPIYREEYNKLFLTWLYEDATIYLERKYNRYYQYYHNGIMFTTYEEGGW